MGPASSKNSNPFRLQHGRPSEFRKRGSGSRLLKVYEQHLTPKDYGQPLRQIAISSSGRSKPALIITNDLALPTEQIVRKYARRWLVEKGISQQSEFFHLNKLSSAMVLKVDFDLTMTLLAYNHHRLERC